MDKKRKKHPGMWLYFSAVIFLSIVGMILFLFAVSYILYKTKIISLSSFKYRISLFSMIVSSLIFGGGIAAAVGRIFIRPIHNIGKAFEELSKGNFEVRVPTDEKLSDIREIAEGFNAMAYDLSHVETLRNDFVDNVSHEFKTPIAAIEGYAALLQNPSLSMEKRDYYVEKILNNTHQLTNLLSNILALSKLENQETVLHKKEYMLDEQLRKLVLLLENKWTAKNLEFDIELDAQPFYGNEKLLDMVWFNLLDNAIKHSPQNGTIQVSIAAAEASVSVTVADHGEGMSEETRKHIFEKFYQGDSSHKAEGNGLGLALVKRIVDLCQGSIVVQSEPGKGSAFTVTLPAESFQLR